MKKKLWLITKQEVQGKQRKLGFIERRNNDIYYDFTLINGSHDSYHKDGNEMRTNKFYREKAVKVRENVTPSDFKGVYKLCVCLLQTHEILFLPEVKERDRNKCELIEIDISDETISSSVINIMVEMVEVGLSIPNEGETAVPENASLYEIKELDPWFNITVLGHKENLLFDLIDDGVRLGHINERYTANGNGQKYIIEGSKRNPLCTSYRVKELSNL